MKIILTLFFLCFTVPAWSATYYVAKTTDGGNDSNSCDTAKTHTTGKLTFLAGLTCANSVGDRLIVKAGTYNEAVPSSTVWPTGTSWANAGRVVAYQAGGPGTAYDVVTLNNPGAGRVLYFSGSSRQYIIIEGFILDGTGGDPVNSGDTVKIDAGAHHIRLINSEVKNAVRQGILISTSTPVGGPYSRGNEFINLNVHDNGAPGDPKSHGFYVTAGENIIERCDIHNNEGFGIHIYDEPSYTKADSNIVRFNKSYLNGKSGILLSSGTNNIAHNNLLYSNTESGIQIGYQAIDSKIYNNTIYGNRSGIEIRNNTGTGTIIKNNIFYSTGTNVLWFTGTPPLTTANITDANNLKTGDPGFADAASGDFSLVTGSMAINAGVVIEGEGFDFNGTAPDQGAHETFLCNTENSAVIPDTAPTTVVLTCINNLSLFTPLLPSTGCAGFTFLKNAASHAMTCTRTANNVLTFTSGTAFINTDAVTVGYSSASGTVTNSALLGNTQNQRLLTFTAFSALNRIGSATPVLDQVACRFENYGGTENAPDSIEIAGVGQIVPPSGCGRVRCQVKNTGADVGESGYSVHRQVDGSGGYTALVNGPCSPSDLCFSLGSSTLPPELQSGPTTLTTTPMTSAGVFKPGGVLMSAAETPSIFLTVGDYTEITFPFCAGSASAGHFFDFRLVKAGGIPLTTYTQTPRVTVSTNGQAAQMGAR